MSKLSIDAKLVEQALILSNERTAEAVVTRALEEYVARRSTRKLMDLMGKLEWDPRFAYKRNRIR